VTHFLSAILLAAGLSQRMGEDKLLLEYKGKSLLQHALDLLEEIPAAEKIVVTSDARSEKVQIPQGVRLLINAHPEKGQCESIRIGVEGVLNSQGEQSNTAAPDTPPTSILFLTADQPKLKPSDLRPFLEASKENPDKIIYPLIDNQPNSPTIFPSRFFNDLMKLATHSAPKARQNGGKAIRDSNPEHCLPIIPQNPQNFIDIDTTEDYDALI